MKIGIGIDTGGTCTDAVIYDFQQKKILAYKKTHTTKDDLSRGIARVLSRLPKNLVDQSEVLALSTTLATNACVENKGGRAKLVFFGANPSNVKTMGHEYGLSVDDNVIFVDSKTRPNGKVVKEPDWDHFQDTVLERFKDTDAVGIVEMYARKSGAKMEQKAKEMIQAVYDIPVVCGNELFSENNIIKRGASTLLNARLISIIDDFIQAVKKALEELDIHIPFVIVRSDGTVMTEKFAKIHPIETLLCGPVASVMGAIQLSEEKDCIIIDMGGTTTDISFVKNGIEKRVEGGVKIGKWNTFVKGLFVDTFGLGGDSGIVINEEHDILIEDEKVIPLCMAVSYHPRLLDYLRKKDEKADVVTNQKDLIFIGMKDISDNMNYSALERGVATTLFRNPMSLGELGDKLGKTILRSQIERLVRETVLLRCGVTPTDVMHIQKDFLKYNREASILGVRLLARCARKTVEDVCDYVYELVRKKLYCNLCRIMMEDAFPAIGKTGIDSQLHYLIEQSYNHQKEGKVPEFLDFMIRTPATLVGVGAPTHVFLKDVGKMLRTKIVLSEYSKVANALGAVVGNVSAKITMEVTLNQQDGSYSIFGNGERYTEEQLEDAKEFAKKIAMIKAEKEAILRGAKSNPKIEVEEKEEYINTEYGPVFMGYVVTATAIGEINLEGLL